MLIVEREVMSDTTFDPNEIVVNNVNYDMNYKTTSLDRVFECSHYFSNRVC
jgi:hypothetical protein